jgi:DNA-binding HxlR family transcriptional regulator
MRRLMTDCSQKMLSQTLKNLELSHLVHREVYPEVPPRVEYSLTDTGRSLMPVLTDLIAWGQQHFKDVVTD